MFFSSLRGTGQQGTLESFGDFWRGLIGSGGGNSAGVSVTPETALGVPILHNCVTLLAETLAQLPLEVYERKEKGQRE